MVLEFESRPSSFRFVRARRPDPRLIAQMRERGIEPGKSYSWRTLGEKTEQVYFAPLRRGVVGLPLLLMRSNIFPIGKLLIPTSILDHF